MKISVIIGLVTALLSGSAVMAAHAGVHEVDLPLEHVDYLGSRKPLLAGVRLEPTVDLVFEPQFGLGHARREREVRSGYDEITHTIHAQAGGSVSLFQTFSLTAAAKFPVYSIESSDRWVAGAAFSQPGARRHGYDILHPAENLSWMGEMGIRLGEKVDFTVFYDQSRRFNTTVGSGGTLQEDRFGTRLIFHFE